MLGIFSIQEASMLPTSTAEAVLKPSEKLSEDAIPVSGIDFDQYKGRDITVKEMIEGMTTMGFQATSLAQAAQIINDMVCIPLFMS